MAPNNDSTKPTGLAELEHVSELYEDLAARLRVLTQKRDSLIREISNEGASRRQVARSAGLTVGRVQQIVSDSEAPSPRVSAMEQRLSALSMANEVRVAVAQLKRDIYSQSATAAAVIAEPPPLVMRASIGGILRSQPGWGPARCNRLLSQLDISPDRALGALTDRQRGVLIERIAAETGKG